MHPVVIRVAEFTRSPGGRHKQRSSHSGEEFRDDVLIPALKRGGKISVVLDGVRGYGSSFLEEAFGGLVRVMGWTKPEEISIELVATTNPSWKLEADGYIADEINRAQTSH